MRPATSFSSRTMPSPEAAPSTVIIDCHNHLHQFPHPDEILRESLAAGITRQIVNGTCEDDWEQVSQLCLKHPQALIPAFGLHPWHVGGQSKNWRERLRHYLCKHPAAIVGECGLDRWKVPFDEAEQQSCLNDQISLARELARPVTIHCLRAWGPLLELLKAHETLPAFLLHAYGGSREMAEQFAKLGSYFSFSGYFLQERKGAQREAFRSIPPDRLLIETDAPAMTPPPKFRSHPLPDGQNHPANLTRILPALARIRGTSLASLTALLQENTMTFLCPNKENRDL